jgi:hypothetical protein
VDHFDSFVVLVFALLAEAWMVLLGQASLPLLLEVAYQQTVLMTEHRQMLPLDSMK